MILGKEYMTICETEARKSLCLRKKGGGIYFLALDMDNQREFAGKPYCTICSKMELDVGIKEFVLWHPEGINVYGTKEYNELSFRH